MKKDICVIFGGMSPEHDISCISVTSVIENLNKDKYNIHMIGITKKGEWFLYCGDYKNIPSDGWLSDSSKLKKAIISPDSTDHSIIVFNNDKFEKLHIDVIFPVLHGEYGEDGTIQGLFELSGVKYVGMGVASSANGMDKTFSKMVFDWANIPQAAWLLATKDDDLSELADKAREKLGFPCFVKPATTGSSVGVGKAFTKDELIEAIKEALKFSRKVLIEEFIDGHEVECSILGNENPMAGEVGEIVPLVEFYDFDAKYKTNTTKLNIPADLSPEVREEVRMQAIKAFKALDGSGLSRVDFFVKYSDNSVVLNEINTLPGFTSISMYPKLWMAMGVEYSELLDRLINLAEKRVK